MVEITPDSPPAQVAVGSSTVDSEAITEEGIDVNQEDHGVDSGDLPSGFTAPESLESDGDHDAVGSSMPPDWQSRRTQRSRQIGLIVALSAASLIVAAMLFGLFVKNWRQAATSQPPVDTESLAEAEQPDTATVAPSEPAEDVSQQPEEPSADPVSDVPAETTPNSDVAELPSDPPAKPEKPPSSNEVKEPSQTAVIDPALPEDLFPRSPLDPLAPDQPEEDEDSSKMERLPKDLQKFVPIFEVGGQQQGEALEAPPSLDDIDVEGAAEEDLNPMLVATPPEAINMRRALAIEFALAPSDGGYPLSDLILVVSQITGVPIQIDWVGFDLIGVGIRDEIPIKKGWNSAKTLLDSIAESVGGVIEQDENMLRLEVSEEIRQQKWGGLLDLSDFGNGQQSAKAMLNQFVTFGDIGIALDQEPDQQKLAIIAVEALRRIRSVAPKVADKRLRRWAQPASEALMEWPVLTDGNAGPQYDAPLTMAGFLRRTARANDATCFLNCFDANRRRLSPAQLVLPFTGATAGEVVGRELEPFGLQVRAVDANHWWVGSEATYDRFPVVVWTDPLGPDQAVFTQRLAGAVNSTDGQMFRIAVDSETGRALILLPRYLVRQLPTIQNGLNLTKAP